MRTAAIICTCMAVLSAGTATAAPRRTAAYDGAWSLTFVTQRGACDPTYNFDANITDGIVSNPNLVRFRGEVLANGRVHATVAVQDKVAAGSGRLTASSGRGTWSGSEGDQRCSGYWTAQRE
jgi:hypothetical protein